MKGDLIQIIKNISFRPLSGSYISQWRANVHTDRTGPVSVPYRGATFLNILLLFFSFTSFLLFPSPIGELHFSMRFSNTTKRRTNLFPSPIGELHFSITHLWTQKKSSMTFPSPIGELHFSIVLFATLGIFLWIVSVPYRGATFLNIYPILSSVFIFEFPSPIGELHFSILCLI